jgi:hypothetical protein
MCKFVVVFAELTRVGTWRVCFSRVSSLSIPACGLSCYAYVSHILRFERFMLAFPSFSASGIAASTSLVKSLSALRTSPLDMVAGL